MTIAREENFSPTLKLTLTLTQTPTLTRVQFSSRGNCPHSIFLLGNLYTYAKNITSIVMYEALFKCNKSSTSL